MNGSDVAIVRNDSSELTNSNRKPSSSQHPVDPGFTQQSVI
jgi:hypothetical protein